MTPQSRDRFDIPQSRARTPNKVRAPKNGTLRLLREWLSVVLGELRFIGTGNGHNAMTRAHSNFPCKETDNLCLLFFLSVNVSFRRKRCFKVTYEIRRHFDRQQTPANPSRHTKAWRPTKEKVMTVLQKQHWLQNYIIVLDTNNIKMAKTRFKQKLFLFE